MQATKKLHIDVNLKDKPGNLTWNASRDTIKIKLMSADVDLTLDFGPEMVRELQQALSWTSKEN